MHLQIQKDEIIQVISYRLEIHAIVDNILSFYLVLLTF